MIKRAVPLKRLLGLNTIPLSAALILAIGASEDDAGVVAARAGREGETGKRRRIQRKGAVGHAQLSCTGFAPASGSPIETALPVAVDSVSSVFSRVLGGAAGSAIDGGWLAGVTLSMLR